MCASRGCVTLAPCTAALLQRQGAWCMRTTHELNLWFNPPTPLGVEEAGFNSERKVFRRLEHVISATLDCTLFKVSQVDCRHQVCLLFSVFLLTTNVTKYGLLDLYATHRPFVLVLGLFNPFAYQTWIVALWLFLRLTVQVRTAIDNSRNTKLTGIVSNLELPVFHIFVTSVLLLYGE